MNSLYNIVEGIFDVTASSIDKYTAGKTAAEIEWMMENSHPKTQKELRSTIKRYCNRYGWNSDLNWIDVSNITDLSGLFYELDKFNGDISKWDVSNVKDMHGMFACSDFNQDISDWDVSNVEDMRFMFKNTVFDGDISKWNTRRVTDMRDIFKNCRLEKNPPKWYKD